MRTIYCECKGLNISKIVPITNRLFIVLAVQISLGQINKTTKDMTDID